jgi:hypothetical protein
MRWLKQLWLKLWWWFTGGVRSAQLQDPTSPARSEAEEAVARVVYESDIAPDCVAATVVRGGPAIVIFHEVQRDKTGWRHHRRKGFKGVHLAKRREQEVFIHRTYALAADKALEWIEMQKNGVATGGQSKMNRKERRAFDAKRKHAR